VRCEGRADAFFAPFPFFLSLRAIASRRYHPHLPVNIGGGIADHDQGEHVDAVQRHFGQGGENLFLAFAAGVAHDPDRGLGRTGGEQQLPGPRDMPHSALAAGVVEGHDEICRGRCRQALLDQLPGGEQVGERDDGKVVHQRSAKDRGGSLDRRYAGDNLYVWLCGFLIAVSLVFQ